MTFQVLPVGVLQNILQLTVGPQEERYVGGGRSATVLPVVLDTDSHGLCKLRLVCKAFRDAARAIPVFVSASTPRQIGSLATTFFQGWDIAAVQLNLSAQAPHDMVAAACALPDRERSKIVSVSVPGGSVAQLAAGLGQLEGLQHVVIHGTFTNPYCLPHIERLELRDMQSCTPEMLVTPPCNPCRRRRLSACCAEGDARYGTSFASQRVAMCLCRRGCPHHTTSTPCTSPGARSWRSSCPLMQWQAAQL